MENRRIYCVDILRGLDIFVLLVVCYRILPAVFKLWPPADPKTMMLCAHTLKSFAGPGNVPAGFSLMDFAQPLFVFVTGVSAALAFRKFDRPEGLDAAGFWKRLASRTLMLWLFGSLIRGILEFKLFTGTTTLNFCLYADTLHTIAVAYFGASVGLLLRAPWKRLLAGLVLVGTAAAVLAVCGDYTQHGNAARLIEEAVYTRLGGRAKDFCYILTTLTWAGMSILASLAGDVLKGAWAPWRKARVLALAGLAVFAVGWLLSLAVPPIRYIYTVSFVFETQGLALLLLAGLFVLTDIWNVRRGTGLLLLFGQCSLVAWVTCNFFHVALVEAAGKFIVGLPRLLGTAAYQSLASAIVQSVLLTLVLVAWRRLRAARKAQAATKE